MRAKWLWVAALAAAAAGCGEGRAIFNIDVFSFLSNVNADTLPYSGPLPLGLQDTIPVQTVNSIGIGGSSLVDTVRLTGSVDFVNDTGTGNVHFAVYFDTLKSRVYLGDSPNGPEAAVPRIDGVRGNSCVGDGRGPGNGQAEGAAGENRHKRQDLLTEEKRRAGTLRRGVARRRRASTHLRDVFFLIFDA